MTTTPTFWSKEVTLSLDPLVTEPQATALADDTFVVGYESGGDIFEFKMDPVGSFTGGNLLATITSSDANPLSGPQFVQQTDGNVAVLYREEAGPDNNDVIWHLTEGSASNRSSIENTGFDEFLHDATATAGGGSALVFEERQAGSNSTLQVLRFVNAIGIPVSNQIFVGLHDGQSQFDPAVVGLFNGNVAVAYENFTPGALNIPGVTDIRLHVYTSQGGDVADAGNGSHEVIVAVGRENPAFPDIALTNGGTPDIAGDGSLVVVWQDNNGIEFRRFSDERAEPLDEGPRTIAGSAGGLLAHVVALNDGGFMVEWGQAFGNESDGSRDFDIVLQRFDINGNAVGDKVFIANPGDQGPFDVSLTTLHDGRVVVTFNNETGDSTNLTTLDEVILDPRDKTINGTNENDTIVGRLDASTINGLDGNDHLTGMNANDILSGGAGSDTLTGGRGRDTFFGGTGADSFDFNSIRESRVKSPDVIKDFHHSEGDKIDLADVDANNRKLGNQAFHFIGSHGFGHHEGELRFSHNILQGDVNGDGKADFEISVKVASLHTGDFVL